MRLLRAGQRARRSAQPLSASQAMQREVHSESLKKAFERLDQLDSAHTEIGMYVMKAHGGALYGMDFLAFAALNRSKAHIAGFTSLLKAKNLICAGALLETAARHSDAVLRCLPRRRPSWLRLQGYERSRRYASF